MAALLWTLGLIQFGNASFIGGERMACDATVRPASGALRSDPRKLRPAMPFALCERPTDILRVIPDVPPGLVRVLEPVTSKDPDQGFLGGEKSAAKLHAAFAGSVGEAAISVGGVDISL
ncbi:MAG: hypothetical protein HY017_03010 [Betaproteobacteria bacterium]|nr:hypothetical protein [Betaproteobacteria bacterium]